MTPKDQDLRDKMAMDIRSRMLLADKQMAAHLELLQADVISQIEKSRTDCDLYMLLGYYTFRIAELRA